MRSLSSKKRCVKYFLCVIDVFNKDACIKLLKDKKANFNGFIRILNESKRKPNRLWLDQAIKCFNNLMSKWLYENDILIYSTPNEVRQ